MTSLVPDGPRQKLRWFLKVKPGGAVEDLLTGTEANGLFVEMLSVHLPWPKSKAIVLIRVNGTDHPPKPGRPR